MAGSERVLVVGAQGVLGAAISAALKERGFDVRRGGRRPEPTADFAYVDLDDPSTLLEAAGGAELVVNCVLHPSLAPQRAVLHAGGTLLDVASVPLQARRRLEDEGGETRGLVVLHAGLNPGLTTLVLREMLERHPDADRVELVNTLSAAQSAGPNSLEFLWPFVTARSRRPTAVIDLPAPFQRRRCLQIGSGEEGWLAGLADGREGRVYICFRERLANAGLLAVNAARMMRLLRPGMFQLGSVILPGPKLGPDGLSSELKRDLLAVGRSERWLEAQVVAGEGDYRMTVAATVVFSEALLGWRRGNPEVAGVRGAEQIFAYAELAAAFAGRGILVRPLPS